MTVLMTGARGTSAGPCWRAGRKRRRPPSAPACWSAGSTTVPAEADRMIADAPDKRIEDSGKAANRGPDDDDGTAGTLARRANGTSAPSMVRIGVFAW
jgi:hypothetical protein